MAIRHEINHEFYMGEIGSVHYYSGSLCVHGEDGTVELNTISADDIVQLFRNFTCANTNYLDETKASYTKAMVHEIKKAVDKYCKANPQVKKEEA
tara:strand:+ start:196 stop:480 length:285 start_codon:yes stop_codon:yes gene_type:complete